MNEARKRIVVMLSGGGRSLANLIDHMTVKGAAAEIVGVISSRRGVKGLDIARAAEIPTEVIRSRDFADVEEFSAANTRAILAWKADFVVMAGYLAFYELPPELVGRTINIHPSLLPSFGGKGFYGHHVHEAVLASHVRITGCTVHFVDNEYDKGPIILQLPCPVHPDDDADTLAARVFELEKAALPRVVTWLASGQLSCRDGVAVFAPGFELPWRARFDQASA